VIFVHNHPSGDPFPSQDDLVLTARLKQAGAVLGINALDHVIIGEGRYVSLADEGRFKLL
jgi:DNA repair protein RadC